MHLVAIVWMYIATMMAVVEAFSPQGTVLGAVVTFVLYGVLPVAIVLYLMNGRYRGLNRRRERQIESSPSLDPDTGGEPTAAPLPSPVREEQSRV